VIDAILAGKRSPGGMVHGEAWSPRRGVISATPSHYPLWITVAGLTATDFRSELFSFRKRSTLTLAPAQRDKLGLFFFSERQSARRDLRPAVVLIRFHHGNPNPKAEW
jgi:hypothetical protein